MTTIRERIISGIVAGVTAANPGVPVFRSRVTAFSQKAPLAIIVSPVDDQPQQDVIPKTDWTLTLHAIVLSRSDTPDVDADPVIAATHGAIMGDQSQGGYAMDTQPSSVHFEFSDADTTVCAATCEFRIQYRTDQTDLTTW